MMNFYEDEDEDSFVVLDDCPEDSIGQMSLGTLTVDQAVYTIGTLTQRVEQLTVALQKSGTTVPEARPNVSESLISLSTIGGSLNSDRRQTEDRSAQTERLVVSRAVQASRTCADAELQTEESEEEPLASAPESVRNTVTDLRTAMERLSAEKMTCLTSISERDRKIARMKKELENLQRTMMNVEREAEERCRRTLDESNTMREVLADNTHVIESLNLKVADQEKVIASDQTIQRHQTRQIESLQEEVLSLREAARMMYLEQKPAGDEPVMVNRRDAPPVPALTYPQIPEARQHR